MDATSGAASGKHECRALPSLPERLSHQPPTGRDLKLRLSKQAHTGLQGIMTITCERIQKRLVPGTRSSTHWLGMPIQEDVLPQADVEPRN